MLGLTNILNLTVQLKMWDKFPPQVTQGDKLQHFDSQHFLFQIKGMCVPCLTIPGEIYLKLYF